MSKKSSNTENFTIINEVVLTDATIEQLKSFQCSDNFYIKEVCGQLADAIVLIAVNIDRVENLNDATEVMQNLAFIRDNIKNLKKP